MADRTQKGWNDVRRWGRRFAGACAVAAGLLALPVTTHAQDETPAPGFSGFVEASPHVVVQRARGSGASSFDTDGRKSNIVTNMTFRLGGGVKSPAIESLWGRPRVVAYGGVLLPLNESSTIGTQFIETSVAQSGQELIEFSKFSIEYQTSGLAGVGLEFTVPVFDAEITVRPSVESLHLVSRYVGELFFQRTFILGGSDPPQEVRVKKLITQHFLGPSLRIGSSTFRYKSVSLDLFLDTSLLLDVAGTNERVRDNRPNGDSGVFTFETGSGLVQVGAGFQVRWP
jgi:hypothetical protein